MIEAEFSDSTVLLSLARAVKKWRVEPSGAGMTQEELSRRSGVALTSIKRFEKTGNITLGNFVALMRALGLLDRIDGLIPSPDTPGPLDLLERGRKAALQARERAPRYRKES